MKITLTIAHCPCLLKTQWHYQLQWHLPSLDLWLLGTIGCEIQFCYPVLNKEWLDIYVDIWNFQGSYPKCTVLILLKDIQFEIIYYAKDSFEPIWKFIFNLYEFLRKMERIVISIKQNMGTHFAWKSLLLKRFHAVIKCLEFFMIR